MTSAPATTPTMPDTPAPQADARPLRAAAWMSGALLCFSSMAVAGREASFELDTFEIMTYRSLIGLVIVCTVLGFRGQLRGIDIRRPGLHVARNLVHFTGQNLWFFAIATVPLAQVFAFEFTNPLWVAVLAPLLLGEKMTRIRAFAAGLGFLGILIVARPGQASFGVGEAAAALCAIGFALTTITTKKLATTESLASIMFMMTALQSVFGLICAGYDGDMALPSAASAPFVAVIAAAGLTAHFCIANALSCAPATIVAPMEFLRLPLIAAVGAVLYGEELVIWTFVGAAVVLTANLINLNAQRRRTA